VVDVSGQTIERLSGAGGGAVCGLAPGVEAALQDLSEMWVGAALSFGCAAARKRGADQLDTADVSTFLEYAW
jgi:transcription initiation factor TFIID subunit TAF12